MTLQTRVVSILTNPAQEWRTIASEPADVAGLIRGYAAPLAAIPAICRFLGMSVVGLSVPLVGTVRTGFLRGLAGAIVSWVFSLVGVWLAAIVIEKLAPTFHSKGTTVDALKLVVYASTPVWVAGVFNLIPALSILILIAALYSIYVFYLGLPVLMSTPQAQIVPYMVVSALAIIVITFIVGVVATAISGVGSYSML